MAVLALLLFGLIMVFSASFIYSQERTGSGFSFIQKQFIYGVSGLVLAFGVSRVRSQQWLRFSYLAALLTIGLLVLVMIPGIGARVGGAQRWLSFFGMRFQPSELAKLTCILFAAAQIYRKRDLARKLTAGLIAPVLLPIPMMLLLMKQPDFGSVAVISITLFLMIYVGGQSKRILFGISAIGVLAASLLIWFEPYRKARLMTFIDPWRDPLGKGFQVLQSMLGVQAGGAIGRGLGNGKEKLFYLPEAHNDFILAVIGEELGFIGILLLALTYLFVCYRGYFISSKLNENGHYFEALFGFGLTTLLILQATINMCVVLGLVPTKGLNLPFVSYGGSALVVDLVMVGVLYGLSRKLYAYAKN